MHFFASEIPGKDILNEVGRGNTLSVIVEQVLNAGMLRVTTLPDLKSVVIYVAGIMAPKGRARSENGADNPEPFFLQSKFFSEMRILNRYAHATLLTL